MRLKDVLEEKVDEKYYISQEKVDRFIRNLKDKNIDISNFCGAKDNKVKQIGNISNGKGGWENTQTGRIYSINGCSPVLNACGGGNREPKIIQIGRINSSQDGIVISKNGIAPAHTAGHGNAAKVIDRNSFFEISGVNMKEKFNADKIRIRKLTPKECWRLMGLNDNDCDKASAVGMTNTQLYKQAGNGIITNCVELLAEYLYKAQYNDSYICTDEKYQKNFLLPADRVKTACGNNNYTAAGAAVRGRYNSDGKIEQQIEVRDDELSNAITTVQKDSLVMENI